MRHVQGIGEVAEEAANPVFRLATHHATGTEIDDERKDHDDAKRLVQTIHPMMVCAADPWHQQNRRDQQAAP